MTGQTNEGQKENSVPSAISINYRERQMDFIQISPTEISYLTDTSLPFQLCLALTTTFIGAGFGIMISFFASKNAAPSMKGYIAICFLVAIGFGIVTYILHSNITGMKKQITDKKDQ